MEQKDRLKFIAIVLTSAVLVSCGDTEQELIDKEEQTIEAEVIEQVNYIEMALPKAGFETIEIFMDGQAVDYGYYKDGQVYIAPQLLLYKLGVEAVECKYSANQVSIIADQRLELNTKAGDKYIYVNGRYVFTPTEFIVAGERAFLPEEAIEKIFNVKVKTDLGNKQVQLTTEQMDLICGGKYYYDVNFRGDDIYWLSHIIEAEAGNQPIECMIGVGNVVLNRVEAEEFPNSVFEVVFEYTNTAQFSPIMNSSLSWDTSEQTMAATYLCLEGYTVAENCLFFQNSAIADTNWMGNNREYIVKLGDMDFYR